MGNRCYLLSGGSLKIRHGVEVLCRVEILPRVGGTRGCLLVTSTP